MELEQKSVDLRKAERDKTAERENIGRDLSRLEGASANLQKEHDEIIARLWEEYELTAGRKKIGQKIEQLTAAQRQLSELRMIRALGSVNNGRHRGIQRVSNATES